MIPFFPKQIATRAIFIYLTSLALVSALFFRYSMPFWRMGLGLLFVSGFFGITSAWSKSTIRMQDNQFQWKLFGVAFAFRLLWMLSSYFYYIVVNGNPFEFGAADSMGYHEEAEDMYALPWKDVMDYYFGPESTGISDVGYSLHLTILYKSFGPIILVPRIIKCLLSAWMCVLLYKLASRVFSESVGRMAGIMCCLMPNLIIYCGYHLKETEMLFLEVAFLERMDYLMRVKRYSLWNILAPILLAGSLFFFRTVLGGVAVFAYVSAVVFSNTPLMKKQGRRALLIGWGALALVFTVGTTLSMEVEYYWEQRETNVVAKRESQTAKGSQWAKYATGTVMAPMIIALPLSTMVVTEGQENQLTKQGGNFVRTFMAFFALLAIVEALRQKKWRGFTLIGSFTLGYLGIISITGFSNAERFLLPGLPGLIMMWAYGISEMKERSYKLFHPWCILVVIAEIGWAYFKLGSRGLL